MRTIGDELPWEAASRKSVPVPRYRLHQLVDAMRTVLSAIAGGEPYELFDENATCAQIARALKKRGLRPWQEYRLGDLSRVDIFSAAALPWRSNTSARSVR